MSRAAVFSVALCGAIGACVLLGARPAEAKRGYWFTDLAGELLVPMKDSEARYRRSMGAALRIGYTGRAGLGIAAVAGYSPLPREDTGELRADNHFVTLAAVPRFTLGRGAVRFVLGAGGGVFLEHVTLRPDDQPAVSDTRFAPAALGEAALELHLFRSAALAFGATYRRGFGPHDTEILSGGGALVFTFE